jgi:hypothetical protein
VVELHEKYKRIPLKDVDFIVENNDKILFVEYKNSNIPNASNPKAFEEKIKTDDHYVEIARKFYDSIIYIMACEKNKPIEYIYILECQKADSVIRKSITAKIKKKLPFDLQQENEDIKRKLIACFCVVSIDEWNQKFPEFQINPVSDENLNV